MSDKDRIKQYLEFKGISKNKFYSITGLSVGFLDSGKSLGLDKARIIINAFPDIRLEWLVMGTGDMLCADLPVQTTPFPAADAGSSLAATIDGLMAKIEALARENGALKERISLITSGVNISGGGILHGLVNSPDMPADPTLTPSTSEHFGDGFSPRKAQRNPSESAAK